MRLLILGSTGRTGVLVVEEAIAHGFEINCLVRNRKRLDINSKIRVIEEIPQI